MVAAAWGKLAVQLADADDRMTGTTDSKGRNYAVWTLGLDEGTQVAKVAAGFGEPNTFSATVTVLHARAVSTGKGYACAILEGNRPFCWGANPDGQLGTGDTLARVAPSPVVGLPTVQEILASIDNHTCARDLAGDVWCWGKNVYGEAGPAASQPMQLTPVRVPGAEGAVSLSLSGDYWKSHTCAIVGVGGARCWGFNGSGQLGTGDLVSSAQPRPVVGSDDFQSVYSGGDARSCALDSDGEAWCWGNARAGEFSPLPLEVFTVPARPLPGKRYHSLGVGYWRTCGLQFDGRMSCWGQFNPGTEFPWPVQIDPNLAQVVGNGWDAVFARSRFGELYAYGEYGNYSGQAVLPIVQHPRFDEISGADDQFCGISESGGVYCGEVGTWYNGYAATVSGVPALAGP